MKSTIRIIPIFIAAIIIASCGFHLQAETILPLEMAQTRLEIQNPYSPFARRLSNLLEQSGINIVEASDSGAVLEVPLNVVRKEILTIGDNARVREYRVRHSISFRLLDSNGQILIPDHKLEQSRVISFDEQDILAAAQEEEFLRKNMADTLSRLVIRHLGTAEK
ncbi:MAG: LPS-assembly lipoprotein [Lysobacterales bacterium]|jgi:LPS-assembly lipoprotein